MLCAVYTGGGGCWHRRHPAPGGGLCNVQRFSRFARLRDMCSVMVEGHHIVALSCESTQSVTSTSGSGGGSGAGTTARTAGCKDVTEALRGGGAACVAVVVEALPGGAGEPEDTTASEPGASVGGRSPGFRTAGGADTPDVPSEADVEAVGDAAPAPASGAFAGAAGRLGLRALGCTGATGTVACSGVTMSAARCASRYLFCSGTARIMKSCQIGAQTTPPVAVPIVA